MVAIQILSDHAISSEYCAFLRRQLAKFKVVFLVLGSHEPSHASWASTRTSTRASEETIKTERGSSDAPGIALSEFALLDQARCNVPGSGPDDVRVTFLGYTLFSRVPPRIEEWTAQAHSARFEEELACLNQQVTTLEAAGKNRRTIIFTHYGPTVDDRAVDLRHRNNPI
ncbi:hypothetical protein ONZ43_g1143 [Nemania bipapillata]|uniref:Uncharacterized protein n=1 Tax=Nemania bipapillata TaxID=110536 RepID=A0ACC2J5I1_9PEZI|nr:hypothetical protein ONZ43_g1143 [Nemania bipapillata]